MKQQQLNWTNVLFLAGAHIAAVGAIVYLACVQFSWWTLGLGILWAFFCGVSITGGYHRLFAHESYEASRWLQGFYLMFGAASVQNSALKWVGDHRAHHAHTDEPEDPYNIERGFWWAHVGWIVYQEERSNDSFVRKLGADPMLQFQHRHYVAIAIVFAAVIPFFLGLLWGDPFGALLVAGFLRLVLQWHATFAINSLTHSFGSRPFCKNSSARDSFWIALLTLGEGYHNFHHRFQSDYRNGFRWYHFDPTKWWVWGLSQLRQTWNLRRVPTDAVQEALSNPT